MGPLASRLYVTTKKIIIVFATPSLLIKSPLHLQTAAIKSVEKASVTKQREYRKQNLIWLQIPVYSLNGHGKDLATSRYTLKLYSFTKQSLLNYITYQIYNDQCIYIHFSMACLLYFLFKCSMLCWHLG